MFARLSSRLGKDKLAVAFPFRGNMGISGYSQARSNLYVSPYRLNNGHAIRQFGSYIENYYTTNHASTGFSTPLRKNFVFMVFVFQAVFTFGYLFHTNYYFTGKALPKPDHSTQLCSDSR